VLFAKRRGDVVVFVRSGGVSGQITLAQAWTDQGPAPMPHRLSVEGLTALDTLSRSLTGR
jgi:hypothetical protein